MFFNCQGTVEEFIKELRKLVGEEGTILVPTFNSDKIEVFDVLDTKSEGGYFSEVFRRTEGAYRSIDGISSACAIGKNAEYLVSEHYKSTMPWDKYSPYYKFYLLGGKVVEIGLDRKMSRLTLLHCVTCNMYDKINFFKKVLSKTVEYDYIDEKGRKYHKTEKTKSRKAKQNIKKFMKYFKKDYKHKKFYNINISMIDAKVLYNKALKLAEEGKFIYKI